MSIVECREQGEGRQGAVEFQGNRIIVRSTRVFKIYTGNPADDDQVILATGHEATPDPLPTILSVHPGNPELRLKSMPIRQDQGEGVAATCWIATCEYDNQTSEEDATDAQTQPIDRRTRWHMEFSGFTRVLERDINGLPIVNTIGDVFDPPLEEEDERPVLVAVKNYPATNLSGLMALIADYRGAVNSDTFLGVSPGSWRVARVQMSPEQVEDDIRYHSVSWYLELKEPYEFDDPAKIEGDPEPWDRLVLNRGLWALEVANDTESWYRIPGNEPRNLRRDGTLIVEHDGIDPDYYYRSFRVKKRRPFSALGLI